MKTSAKEKSVKEKAREQAFIDWQTKSVARIVNGRINNDLPAIVKGQLFYPRYIYLATPEDEFFCEIYKETIRELVEKEGVPDWAPVKRIPERQETLYILGKDGQSFQNFSPVSIREKRIVESVIEKWRSGKPNIWTRVLDKHLLILGGDTTSKAGRVDVIDTEKMMWLASFEFLRKHCPEMPWDRQVEKVT
jgi:hypothetical protein